MMKRKIIISGPESTGKSELCEALANHFGGLAVPEHARVHIEQLSLPYTREDVLDIAKVQLEQIRSGYAGVNWVFFDTGLIITKVWLEFVYDSAPRWISDALREHRPDLVLLCYPDLPWIPDPVRENGGEMRIKLFNEYEKNLKEFSYPYHIVKGQGEERVENAIGLINNSFH